MNQEAPEEISQQIPSQTVDEQRRNSQLFREGYRSIVRIEDEARRQLLHNVEQTKRYLGYYFYSTRFQHQYAYDLCAVAGIWPDFMHHSKELGYVMLFVLMNSTDGKREIADKFEVWFNQHRQRIAFRVAERLGIMWEDVEAVGASIQW